VSTNETEVYHPPVGAGAATSAVEKQIGAKTLEVLQKYPGTPMADARRLATLAVTGKDSAPTQTGSGIVVPQKGGQVGRLAKVKVGLQTAQDQLTQLDDLMSKPSLSPADKATAATLTKELEANGVQGIPDNPLGLGNAMGRLSGASRASIHTAMQGVKQKLDNIDALSASGALSEGAPGGDEATP
jgi:hypothetical protein